MPYDSDPAIDVQDLAVTYRASYERVPTLKSTLVRLGRRQRMVREIHALRGVSFQVPHGAALGIVGANGAGKSTLVRTLAGILPPTSGRVVVNGKVSTLLALGVGFNPNLTGRENVVLGGLAAGLKRIEVAAKYDEIAEFADLGDFMELPMKTYSSGMYSRLAFSVGVHMEPDILLIDEALSAGDAAFKEKAMGKMRELMGNARTIVLVSHALQTVKDLCDHAIWMHQGTLRQAGTPDEIVTSYTRFLRVGETAATLEDV